MKRSLIILPLAVIIFSGCGTTLKQQWYDFNAYYNTFYNARQYYESGLEQNHSLREDINPFELIRIHPPPTSAGAEDFEQVIIKSSDILRRHSHSRYIDDAIYLIGVSYFYRQEFFASRDKFRELHDTSTDPEKRELATIWEGRTYIELQLYNEGIRFMESRLEEPEFWTPARLAEARAVLAQLFTYRGHLYMAANQLLLALEDLEGEELKPRAWFHYGQIMERLDNLEQATFVFSEIQGMRTQFNMEYHAKLKEIEILRNRGELETAAARLRTMERDDKFFSYRPELLYEIAKTERHRTNAGEAVRLLNRVIHSRTATPGEVLVARSYYELAEIYRENYSDFTTAAAYYDSASASGVDESRLPPDWNAGPLSQAFGEYSATEQEISRLDSLLELGGLSPEELDRRVAEIERRHREELEEQLMRQEDRERLVVSVTDGELESTTEAEGHGFMNVNNRERLNESSLRFHAVWGRRPLTDDWRRREAVISRLGEADTRQEDIPSEGVLTGGRQDPSGDIQLDLSDIPVGPASRDSLERQLYGEYFRLGNIFLLNLDMPDSAKVYFEKIVREGPEQAPKASALYGLAEIGLQEGDEEEAHFRAGQLIRLYPESVQARRIADRTGLSLPSPAIREPEDAGDAENTGDTGDTDDTGDTGDVPAESGDAGDVPAETGPDARRLMESDDGEREDIWAGIAGEADSPGQAAERLISEAVGYIRAARQEDPLYDGKQRAWQQIKSLAADNPDVQELLNGTTDSLMLDDLPVLLPVQPPGVPSLSPPSLPPSFSGEDEPDELDNPDQPDDPDNPDQPDNGYSPAADSRLLTREKVGATYPYSGGLWDLARALLVYTERMYPGTDASSRAGILREELEEIPDSR
ncbi:MAG: hypothetical protein WD317_04260 [Balneolaceae bacterium]